ncbi:hypothetical protein RRSWK_00921 [Rhodopirellula sp. SWK7]|nr:hypothetical protein RRSWK_00921 [Rhodopirellula sp. SWK7]
MSQDDGKDRISRPTWRKPIGGAAFSTVRVSHGRGVSDHDVSNRWRRETIHVAAQTGTASLFESFQRSNETTSPIATGLPSGWAPDDSSNEA